MGKPEYQVRAFATNFKTRSAEDGSPVIEGYFAVFGEFYDLWENERETIDPHAFDEALDGDIRALIDHETRLVLGRTTAGTLSLSVDEHGLYGVIKVNPDDSDAMNLYARTQRGDVSQASFGFDIDDIEFEYCSDGSCVEHIKKVTLYEVSVVTFPAYTATAVSARSAMGAMRPEIKRRRLDAWRANLKGRLNHGN